jgi:hypothetical protein
MPSFGMLHRVDLVGIEASEERVASIIRVKRTDARNYVSSN